MLNRSLIAVVLMVGGLGSLSGQPQAQPDRHALNQISAITFTDDLVSKMKARISAAPTNESTAKSTTAIDLDYLYQRLVKFSGNRLAYTQALANYADAFEKHSGIGGILYRDQAYSQLVQSADDLLASLKSLNNYLFETRVAVHGDTQAIDATLREYSDAKGFQLRSITDHLNMTGITAVMFIWRL